MSATSEIEALKQLESLAQELASSLLSRGLSVATVESCTGGLLAGLLTSLSGSSNWFDRGFVTYSNLAKHQQIGVGLNTVENFGAVSEQVAAEMAEGGLLKSEATMAISVTGVAGPGGGSVEKPVGTVWIAWAQEGALTLVKQFRFEGDRASIRIQTIHQAISQAVVLLSY